MPAYYPEGDAAQCGDNSIRALHKIASLGYNPIESGTIITTEGGLEITTESGDSLITE
jgi:hypothetical protein